MVSVRRWLWLPALVIVASAAQVRAGILCPRTCAPKTCAPATCAPKTCAPATCAPTTCQPACEYVEKTVMCPTRVTEYRKVTCVECRPEPRTRTVTDYRRVPEVTWHERQCTVMVPEIRTRTEDYTVCKPIWKTVDREVTVMVPHVETRQGTRKVCKMVPEKQTKIVCEDQGHWEERPSENPCAPVNACDPCAKVQTCKVWVPNIVKKEVEVTCMKPTWVEEPCEYQVTVCKPETRTCTERVCEYQQEVQTRQVRYCEYVPKQIVKRCPVTTYRCEPIQKTIHYTAMVPHQVEKTIPVTVCKMVPKTIKVPVPVCCPKPCCPPPCACGKPACSGC